MSYEDRISIATPEGVDLQMTLAGVGSRFIATAIDQTIQWSVILALFVGLAVAGTGMSGEGSGPLFVALFVTAIFLVQFTYDVLFEVLASGRTPGKRWTGLRVVRTSGAPVGFVTSAVRNVLRLVDALPGMYLVGIIAVLASSRNQRLGDMAAGTLVVRERRGGRSERSPAWAQATGPAVAAAPAGWDVSAITADELATVRRFLDRRAALSPDARAKLAEELYVRLRPKVVGPPDGLAPEPFLEDLSAAKAARP